MKLLIDELGDNAINIVDVGAANGETFYEGLIKKYPCNVNAYDAYESDTVQKVFVGDGSMRTFYHCLPNCNSSIYEPNNKWLKLFQNLEMNVQQTEFVQTVTLDSLNLGDIDYLKIDAQGSELNILIGAQKLVKNIVISQLEVCFVPLYINQPLFRHIDGKMSFYGFDFLKFVGNTPNGRTLKPLYLENDRYLALSQQMWNDALYIRPLFDMLKLSPLKLLKIAIILYEVYHAYDFAYTALSIYCKKTGKQMLKQYREAIEGKKK